MKKIVALLIMLFTAALLAQSPGWTTLKETNITVGTNAYDIFTNGAGNHIIVQANDENPKKLKYYRMKVDGSYDIGPSNLETTEVFSSSISGDVSKIYVVYRKLGINNKIKTKYSTNGGQTWSYLPDLNTPEGNAISIECSFSKGYLHVTFLVGTTVYFNYHNTNTTPPSWLTQHFTISDPQITSAVNPRIQINSGGSVDTVYFVWNPSSTTFSWRRYIVGDISPQQIRPIFYGDPTYHIGFAVDNSCLYAFYKINVNQLFSWSVRRIWDNAFVGMGNSNGNYSTTKIFSTMTMDNGSYTAAWSERQEFPDKIVRMGFDHTQYLVYDLIHTEAGLTPVNIVNLSAAGNDVHVVWKDNLSNNKLRYEYYDDVPVPPQNLTITKSANNHPYLSWINPNPDVSLFKIYRRNACIGDWDPIPIGQSTVSNYEDLAQSYCTAIPPLQCPDLCNFEYRVTAVDPGPKESGYSNTVSAWLVGGPPQKEGVNDPVVETVFEYSLGQNYPNPFNPTTTINYSIKSAGDVSLKVYDILGTEVASLVNEVKEPGNYSVTFDATNLPSGMYIYMLSTGNFMATKKLILLK